MFLQDVTNQEQNYFMVWVTGSQHSSTNPLQGKNKLLSKSCMYNGVGMVDTIITRI
jgi:hypothetical protein